MLKTLSKIGKIKKDEDLEFTFEVQQMIKNEVEICIRNLNITTSREQSMVLKLKKMQDDFNELEREYYYQIGKGKNIEDLKNLKSKIEDEKNKILLAEMIIELF